MPSLTSRPTTPCARAVRSLVMTDIDTRAGASSPPPLPLSSLSAIRPDRPRLEREPARDVGRPGSDEGEGEGDARPNAPASAASGERAFLRKLRLSASRPEDQDVRSAARAAVVDDRVRDRLGRSAGAAEGVEWANGSKVETCDSSERTAGSSVDPLVPSSYCVAARE